MGIPIEAKLIQRASAVRGNTSFYRWLFIHAAAMMIDVNQQCAAKQKSVGFESSGGEKIQIKVSNCCL